MVKWVHIISSTILFGTGIGSAFFMFMANRKEEIGGIVFVTRHVVLADWLFTAPAVIIQFATGMLMIEIAGYEYHERWIVWALIAYLFVGVCWLPVVWIQIKMRNMAIIAKDNGEPLPSLYWKMNKIWILCGSLAFPIVIAIFYLMVFKPG